MPEELPLTVESIPSVHEGHCVLRLSGSLTLSNLFAVQPLLRGGNARVTILDLTEVPYIDSAGTGMLMGAYVSRQREGRSLLLVGVSERVQNSMKVTMIHQFFRFFPTVADAENAVKA